MFSLAGKAALITGAASGIGAEAAKRFAGAGADLTLAWYPGDPHDIGSTVAAVEKLGRKVVVVEGDVASTDDVNSWVDACVEGLGRIDVVVANAAIARDVPSTELDDERWNQLMEINLLGVFRCFRAALPHMIEQGSGRLMATSSIAGAVQGWSQHVHYSASKAGVMGMIRGLALEVAPHGITVNGIAPGVIVTPQTLDEVNSLGPQGLDVFGPSVPVGRTAAPRRSRPCSTSSPATRPPTSRGRSSPSTAASRSRSPRHETVVRHVAAAAHRTCMAKALIAAAALAVLVGGCSGSASSPSEPAAPAPPARAPVEPAPIEGLRVPTDGWRTDFSKHVVPLDEFWQAVPLKDGIPSLDEPSFITVERAYETIEGLEPVIEVELGSVARAYPLQIMIWHEIVNDVIDGVPVVVTFCPLCYAALAFERTLDGEVYEFGVSGNLRNSDLVMFDRATESWWQQFNGEALVGELAGVALTPVPAAIVSLDDFAARHPDGDVLSPDTGFDKAYGLNPYPGYDRIDRPVTRVLENEDDRLLPRARGRAARAGGRGARRPLLSARAEGAHRGRDRRWAARAALGRDGSLGARRGRHRHR